jgi:hypothetical protein
MAPARVVVGAVYDGRRQLGGCTPRGFEIIATAMPDHARDIEILTVENERLREEVSALRERVTALERSRWWRLHPRFLSLRQGLARPSRSEPAGESDESACARGGYVTEARGVGGVASDATIVITSTVPDLVALARSFLDDAWPVYVIDGSDGCYGLPAIRHVIEHVPSRRAVLLDEDAFIFDNERLRELVTWADEQGLAAVGVPDGGVFATRRQNPNALNTFFNVLDLDAIRAVWSLDACLAWRGRGAEMTEPWPPLTLFKPEVPYVFDDYEPYYCFYFWLHAAGLSTGYLDARTHSDGMSTIVLDHEHRPLLIHAWHARKFEHPHMRDRILDAASFARGGEDVGHRWRGHDWYGH